MFNFLKASLLVLILSLSVAKIYSYYSLKAASYRYCVGVIGYHHLAVDEFIHDLKRSFGALETDRPACINKSNDPLLEGLGLFSDLSL